MAAAASRALWKRERRVFTRDVPRDDPRNQCRSIVAPVDPVDKPNDPMTIGPEGPVQRCATGSATIRP
jgi:hypothetical protein